MGQVSRTTFEATNTGAKVIAKMVRSGSEFGRHGQTCVYLGNTSATPLQLHTELCAHHDKPNPHRRSTFGFPEVDPSALFEILPSSCSLIFVYHLLCKERDQLDIGGIAGHVLLYHFTCEHLLPSHADHRDAMQ